MAATKPRGSRIAVLKERLALAEREKGSTFDVPFRGKRLSLRRISVEIDFPLYRIQSGRTHRAQGQYLDEHRELPTDFFDDPEDPKVQHAQHQILQRMIAEMDLDKDLKDRGQLAPLVLTPDGYVVDGNRRLAALRNKREEYADAVVLPADAESHEIYETEIELQMQRETKAPYNWIDQALHIEYGIQILREKLETVARRMRMTGTQVTNELEKLNLVRAYLAWLKEDGKYHKVPTASGGTMEQAFEDMAARLSGQTLRRKSEREKRLIRAACFAAIRNGAGYKEIRDTIKHFGQNAEKISDRLKDQGLLNSTKKTHGADASSIGSRPVHPKSDGAEDPLRALTKAAPPTPDASLDDLIEVMSDEDVAPAVLNVVQDLEAEEKESKRQQLPLTRIRRALADLESISLGGETDDLPEIAKVLHRLIKEAERLVSRIEKLLPKKR